MKTYTLKIGNDITISGLTMNGNNYVSETKVNTSAWPAVFKLTVTDSDGNTEVTNHAKLIQQEQYAWDNNRWYLAFGEVSDEAIKLEEVNDTALAGLMATTDLYEQLLDKGVLD
jgi:hypothetical protein